MGFLEEGLTIGAGSSIAARDAAVLLEGLNPMLIRMKVWAHQTGHFEGNGS